MANSYKTISKPTEAIFKDKSSKFIAFAFPVFTEDEIKEIILKLKKEHHSARHHCYAYQLGANKELFRANDDGEPSNSAGKPILAQIQSRDLTNVLVVVVRYFGGILLGVGGLINAYRSASQMSLDNAEIVSKTVEQILEIDFEYSAMNSVMKIVKDFQVDVLESKFDNNCSIKISFPLSKSELIIAKLNEFEKVKVDRIL